jgi:hypothetical protein
MSLGDWARGGCVGQYGLHIYNRPRDPDLVEIIDVEQIGNDFWLLTLVTGQQVKRLGALNVYEV